ncbi:MAG: sigma-70 family RNA polymerase sigma factor [Propionibacteriales bacterium]|nr:sigma-70 family RNA polymerase sigma factor [Propionibacteriales bacterium]
MHYVDHTGGAGLVALRRAVLEIAGLFEPAVAVAGVDGSVASVPTGQWLTTDSAGTTSTVGSAGGRSNNGQRPESTDPETERLVALVDLARAGDSEAFGQLYDHYVSSVYRFLYYRVGSHALAEDLTSETFFRALRSMASFKWQGRDFGAWLMTIGRNLVADHYKSGRQRLEITTDDMGDHDLAQAGPEDDVIAGLTNEVLLGGLRELAQEQQDCLVLRFLQGMSISETAAILQRTEGAVKQLQLRAVRNLAKLLPEGLR